MLLPIYGDGSNIRDWIYVKDHVEAIDKIFHFGKNGETYNIGGDNEISNLDMVNEIIGITDKLLKRPEGSSKKLISFVEDRKGHDFRYAINNKKIYEELEWLPKTKFSEGLHHTVSSYI